MGEKPSGLKKLHRSLAVRLPLLFVLSGLLIMVIMVPIVYSWFHNRMIRDYERMARGITSLMAHYVDGDRVDRYIEENYALEDYQEIRRQLCEFKNSYPDVLYAHVLRFEENGARVVFNLQDVGARAVGDPGQLIEWEKPYQARKKELIRGAEMQFLPGKTDEGYLLSYFRPVFDGEGHYQCHVSVAFSMEELYMANLSYLVGTIVVFAIVITLVVIIDVIVVRRDVIRPMRGMSNCAASFAYDTEAERFQNVQAMEALNIQTHDEIEELYYEFMSVMKETLYYMTNLNRAKSNIQEQEEKLDQISETAYKDALTRVGNQASFNKLSDALSKSMESGKAEFAIVMVDLNNLKYVNDTFGHKLGDNYIKGCCSIICRIYKRSPVFRVGGDEFVVVLRNEDYMSRLLRLTQITEAFMAAYVDQDKEPWERYSASVGMAECEASDISVEQVLKRADKAMYQSKMKFKEKYGSYR